MLSGQVQNDIGDGTSWTQSYKHLLCGHLEPNIVGQVLVMWPWPRISGLRKWVIIVDNYLNSLFHVVKTNDIMYTLQSMVTTTSTCMLGVGVIRVFSTLVRFKKILAGYRPTINNQLHIIWLVSLIGVYFGVWVLSLLYMLGSHQTKQLCSYAAMPQNPITSSERLRDHHLANVLRSLQELQCMYAFQEDLTVIWQRKTHKKYQKVTTFFLGPCVFLKRHGWLGKKAMSRAYTNWLIFSNHVYLRWGKGWLQNLQTRSCTKDIQSPFP